MKIGIITDIHNNVVALDAILKAFTDQGCDEILCCGDIIGIGPFPEETVQRLISMPEIKGVLGNHDRYLVEGLQRPFPQGMSESEGLHHLWEHSLLSEESKDYLRQLPFSLDLNKGGLNITVVHYAMDPANQYYYLSPSPSYDECERMFSNYNADIIIYGHDHKGSVFQGNSKLYINCGTLGCPSSGIGIAQGGILTIERQGLSFKKVYAEYDFKAVLEAIDTLMYPAYMEIKQFFYGISD